MIQSLNGYLVEKIEDDSMGVISVTFRAEWKVVIRILSVRVNHGQMGMTV
jgi:hypothetical protein